MDRPVLKPMKLPRHIDDYPEGTYFMAGHLVDKNAGFRTLKPTINVEKCVLCMKCYLCCPDGVIFKGNNELKIDYDFCKGCGICARECSLKAIEMVREG